MSESLALRYRPRRFADLTGQATVRVVLQRMITTGDIRQSLLLYGSLGSGKAQPLEAFVLTPTGFRRMGDLQVGDPVIDPEGQPSEVTGVFPQGVQDIYRVTFSDGSSCECTEDHLWRMKHPKLLGIRQSREYRAAHGMFETGKRQRVVVDEVRPLRDVPWYALRDEGGASWTLEQGLSSSLDMVEGDLPLDPYTLGLLLGDGHLPARGAVLFGSEDPELVAACRSGVEPLGGSLVPRDLNRENASKWYRIAGSTPSVTTCLKNVIQHSSGPLKRGLCNRHYLQESNAGRLSEWAEVGQAPSLVRSALSSLGLLCGSESKFIPESYKVASAKTRLAVLQGVLDTDGSAVAGGAELSSVSLTLCEDVQWLARSLGYRVTSIRTNAHRYWNVQHQEWRDALDRNRVSIYRSNDHPELFRLERKRVAAYRPVRRHSRLGVQPDVSPRRFASVEFVRRGEVQCISVSARSRHYVTDDFIPTHNTTSARVVASALNCEQEDVASRPCGECPTCRLIVEGRSADVTEIDAASSGLAENMRDLREQARYAPIGRYRVLVIDEVHALSNRGFQTLLKILEEPPPNTVFILVTTAYDKVPDTIASRCLACEFRRLNSDQIATRLSQIAEAEQLSVDAELLPDIATRSRGVMRDAVMLLDQCRLVNVRTSAQLSQLLGDADHGVAVLRPLVAPDGADYPAAFDAVATALGSLPSPAEAVAAMVTTLRRVLVLATVGPDASEVLSPPQSTAEQALARAAPPQRLVAGLRTVWQYYASVAPAAESQASLDLLVTMLGQALAGQSGSSLKSQTNGDSSTPTGKFAFS